MLLAAVINGCDRAPESSHVESEPVLHNAADSLALRIANAAGGVPALEALPALRWDFAVVRDSAEVSRSHHLWDRDAGRHRLEWRRGDSLLVAVFSTEGVVDGMPASGTVYLDGVPVDSARSLGLLEEAYGRFINDMYWLLAPLKVFDPGVHRGVAADSADETTDVLALWFDDVGLTPGDRYWLRADRDSGRMTSWRYRLESGREGAYAWTDIREIDSPAGSITLPTRKVAIGPGTTVLTPFVTGVVDSTFADPAPQLSPIQ
jgi:hypothetical protein